MSLLLLGSLSLSLAAQSRSQLNSGSGEPIAISGPPRSIEEIQDLRRQYHKAVISHDGPGLLRLVLPQGSLWITVLSEESFSGLRQLKPDTQKVHESSFQQFATFLNASKAQLDPQATNVKIFTDGTIATIYFDFKFVIDGSLQNEGSENLAGH